MNRYDSPGPPSDAILVPDTITMTAPVVAPLVRCDERLQGRSGVYIATWQDGDTTAGYVGSSKRLPTRASRFDEYLADLTIIADAAGGLGLDEARVLEKMIWQTCRVLGNVSLTNDAPVIGAPIDPEGYRRLRAFWSECLRDLGRSAGPFQGLAEEELDDLVLVDPAWWPTSGDRPVGPVLELRARGLRAQCVETASGRFRLLAGSQIRRHVVRSAGCVTSLMRHELFAAGWLVDRGQYFELVEDLMVDTRSAAARIVVGSKGLLLAAWRA